MTDEEFEKLEHEYQLGYSKWGQKLKDAEKKWRKLHPPVYYDIYLYEGFLSVTLLKV